MNKFTFDGAKVSVVGELDAHDLIEFEEVCNRLTGVDEARVLLDLSGVEYMSSAFLGVLMSLRHQLAENGKSLVLRPSPIVRRLLDLTGMSQAIVMED